MAGVTNKQRYKKKAIYEKKTSRSAQGNQTDNCASPYGNRRLLQREKGSSDK